MLVFWRKLPNPFLGQCRCISGYKISSERFIRKKNKSNYSDEESFQERINLAVLNRAKTKLRGFDKITYEDIHKRSEGPDPNARFRHQDEANKYRSIYRYFKAAENERRRQKKEDHDIWWKTLTLCLKQERGQPSMKNIGLKLPHGNIRTEKGLESNIERNSEKLSRERKLILDIDKATEDWQNSVVGISHLHQVANHYNIFTDLFGDKEFYAVIPMEINFPVTDDLNNPVYFGNELSPSEAMIQPLVAYEANNDRLYTLLLTNPDGHLENNDREYIHWLVGNIPGDELSKGELLVDYMQPIPARGTGYHRHVFILFEQTGNINFNFEKRKMLSSSLRGRDFKASEFYEQLSGDLTPVSFRFFQCKWDDSVKRMFHDVFEMPEPVYEYEKLSAEPRLARLKRHNAGKTLRWLSRFMPKEMVYPDGSQESQDVRVQAAVEASASKNRTIGTKHPVQNVY